MQQCSFYFNERTQCQNPTTQSSTVFCLEHNNVNTPQQRIKAPQLGNSYIYKTKNGNYRGRIVETRIVSKKEFEKIKQNPNALLNPKIYSY